MKFVLVVNSGPYTYQASDTARHFASAALAKGHEITRVFFYHDGVNNASGFSVPPQDERNVAEDWKKLADEYGIDLAICVAAAQRRGILDAAEAKRLGKGMGNIAAGFRVSGLGLLVEAAIQSDRLLVFGN